MRIFDLIDIILIVVIILCDFFLYAFFLGCRIAYKKGLDDGRENSWRKQPIRDIDKKREARKMKREILFRGKSIQNGKWLYGNIQIPEAPYDEYFMWDNGWQMQVDPDTIGQYIITPMNCAMFPKI